MSRVLLIAPTADGTDVGEAWVSYQWAANLASEHDVTLLTYHKRGALPASRQLPRVRVIEWKEPPFLGRAERLNSMLKPGYILFYVRARRWIRAALARGEVFDVAHQPTPVAMRYPSPVVGLGIPFVIGPVGGSLASPAAFAADEDTAPWFVRLRALDRVRLQRDPLLRRTYERADTVLGIAPYVQQSLAGLRIRRFAVMSETGITRLPISTVRKESVGKPLRLLFVGRVIRTKGVRDLVRAVALLRDVEVQLDVVGDGNDRHACETLAGQLGIGDQVKFHGRLNREDVDQFYRVADVFVFPSYREPGGNVVFEAMAHEIPLIVCDRGGPAAAVDDHCAIRVSAETPAQLAADVAGAITLLYQDPDRLLAMGRHAGARLKETALWTHKVTTIGRVYREIQPR